MSREVKGFPRRFPVRSDGRRSYRYRFVSWVFRTFFRSLFVGRLDFENLPGDIDGPLLVVSNHLSNWDALLFGAFYPGTLFALAKIEIYKYPLVAWYLGGCNCFPVDRHHSDRRATRMAIKILRDKNRLLIFVEGTRAKKPGMKRVEPGVGFLIRHTGARILPVALWGTEGAVKWLPFPRRKTIHMKFGEPETVQGENDQEIADNVAYKIAGLLPAQYRGYYGH